MIPACWPCLLHTRPIQVVGVIRLALPMNGKLARILLTSNWYCPEASARAGVARSAGRDRGDAGLHGQQVGVAAPIERNIDNLLALDRLPDLGVGGVHLCGVFGHSNF